MAVSSYRYPSVSSSPEFSVSANMGAFNEMLQAALDGAMAEAAGAVADEARKLVPVDTGLLKQSIHVARYEHDGIVSYQVETGPGRDNREYGLFVEFGTVKTRAQPFLRPAMERIRPADRVRMAMKSALAQAAQAAQPPPFNPDRPTPMTTSAMGSMFNRAAGVIRGIFGRAKGLFGGKK